MNSDDCKKLQRAFDEILNKIGPTFKQVIYEELEKVGISLEYPCSSLNEIEKALQKSFGEDGSLLLVQAIRRQMGGK